MKGGRRRKSARERVAGCQTGVEAPGPSHPPSLSVPPHPSLAEGEVDMGARWGGDEKKHSTHGWRLSY